MDTELYWVYGWYHHCLHSHSKISIVGLALGAGAALALTRILASLLYDTSPTDRAPWIVAGALLAAVALLACYFPARRVTKVDPLTILRFE